VGRDNELVDCERETDRGKAGPGEREAAEWEEETSSRDGVFYFYFGLIYGPGFLLCVRVRSMDINQVGRILGVWDNFYLPLY